jgi:Fic family protein
VDTIDVSQLIEGAENVDIYRTPELGPEEETALQSIADLRRQLRHMVAEPRRWMGSVRRVLSARAIQGSNSIEGHHVSVEDAIAAVDGEEMTDAAERDARAVEGYRRAMTYVLQLAGDEHFTYNAAVIRSLHFMMTEYDLGASPGLWRSGQIFVRNEASGDVVYEGPDHSTVPALVDALVASLEASDPDTPVLVRAAMAHLNLVMIHPFRDGNGRMSRAVQTLVLARDRILAPEFSSIEEYLGAQTARYYAVLESVGQGSWSPGNDTRPWVRFCLEAHYVQAASVLRRFREGAQISREISDLRRAAGLPERAEAALFDATIGLRVRNAGYRAFLQRGWAEEISHALATSDLRAMVKAGLLEAQGRNRGASYVAAAPLIAVRAAARTLRQSIDTSRLFDPS